MSLTLAKGRFDAVNGPVLTIVLDGVGLGPKDEGNAWFNARTPVLDAAMERYGYISLAAHGLAVGLPSDGDMGNSEVGHNALGAGRIFSQGARLCNEAIEGGSIFEGETWKWLIEGVKASGEPLHFIGLLSDGNVHSHEKHLHAMLRRAAEEGVRKVRIHILLDGRDVGETSALTYVERLDAVLDDINMSGYHDFQIASGGGRMVVTMDRYEANWGMVDLGWKLHVKGEGRGFRSANQAIETFRAEQPGITDQFLPGFVVVDENGSPVGPIHEGASVVLFNFRGDRAIEISRAFEDETMPHFDRGPKLNVRYAGIMQYDGDLKLPKHFLVAPPAIDRTLGEHLAFNKISQFACAETQKFGHVTYFWNGNRTGRFDDELETYVEVPSDNVPFEQRPWMKAAEVVDATIAALESGKYRYLRLNLANGDMVGHTGSLDAAIIAMEAVDISLGRLLKAIEKANGVALITADHGNCDEMFERKKDGSFKADAQGRITPRTSHTLNQVPAILFDPKGQVKAKLAKTVEKPGLANVAATMLELMGFEPPADYEPSLLK